MTEAIKLKNLTGKDLIYYIGTEKQFEDFEKGSIFNGLSGFLKSRYTSKIPLKKLNNGVIIEVKEFK